MKPPPTKKARPAVHTADSVRQIVAQAMLSDDAACATLLESVVGFEKEILDGLIVVLKTFSASKVTLNDPITKVLRKYFALIGVETATERYKQFHDCILNNLGTEYVSNFVSMICCLLRFCNILRYDKLRQEVVSSFPTVIRMLWKNNSRGEACSSARLFVELLLCMECYHGQEYCSDIWFERVLTKEMERFPFFAAVSAIMSSRERNEEIVSLSSLQELNDGHEHVSLRLQMNDLLLSHLSSFCSRCSVEQMRTFVEFLLRHSLAENSLAKVMEKLRDSSKAITNNVMDLLIADTIINLSVEQISAMNKEFDPSIFSSLDTSCNIHTLEQQQTSHSDEISKKFGACLSRILKMKPPSRKEVTEILDSLVSAYCSLPLHLAPPHFMPKYLIFSILFSNIFQSIGNKIFASCLGVIEKLTRGIRILPLKTALLRKLCDSWLVFVEESSVSGFCRDIANALSGIFALSRSDTASKLCPALDILENFNQETCSRSKTVSLYILFASTDWEKLAEDKKENAAVLEKIRSHYASMLSSVNWKDSESMQCCSEQCSLILSCWDSVPRSVRPVLMKSLINRKDVKILRKLTTRIIEGKVEAGKILMKEAFDFHLKYIPLLSEGQHSLDDVLDYNSLVIMLRAGISVDVALTQMSTEKVKDILSLCLSNEKVADEMLNLVELLISSKLKDVEDELLVSLSVIYEKCAGEYHAKLLSAAAQALEMYGHTEKERDVVSLCFSMLSVLKIIGSNFDRIRSVQRVLDSAMRYAHPSVNNDQCSVFAQLFIKVFKAVQEFITSGIGKAEEVDELVHGLNSIAHALTLHKIYYTRIVGTIISAVICQVNELEFVMYKLHSISDKHNASMLATNLPPSERLQYKRLFSTLKRSKKLVT
ncbi:unnamed protein product [Cylicocyclus nassatus]|uniref:Uncharacterized protein n=1 Tax=Cylicocyclus nassatus TaxID=53992 RepID=A0AA36DLN0_CYLNA|nr:unnamed protein product [Cylicocyclus nassatus]